MKNCQILILDYGSQYTKLIAKKIQENHLSYKIIDPNTKLNTIFEIKPIGIILSGGPNSVYGENKLDLDQSIIQAKIPILGICYGMQILIDKFGGSVQGSTKKEFGNNELFLNNVKSLLFDNIPNNAKVWMSHGDEVTKVPSNFQIIGKSHNSIAAIADEKRKIYGLQFHPEVTHTEIGDTIFQNFIFKICQGKQTFLNKDHIQEQIKKIQNSVQEDKVILALSGGVDSMVTSVLLHKAIGQKLYCFFVNHGLLRENESLKILNYLQNHYKMQIKIIDAKKHFLNALKGIKDPEQKRKIIGKEFIYLFEKESKKIDAKFLAQGTIYSDLIESSRDKKNSKTIKSHHNVGGLPKEMKLKLLEPIADFFKDEVRLLGEKLGLPHEFIYQHPFPGPGFAVRIIGDVNERALKIVKEADKIFIEELKLANIYEKGSQSFAVFLPIKSVGVKGDYRTYENVIVLRSINTKDFMTGNVTEFRFEFLNKVATRILNEVDGVNRVTYDITSKPPGTIEWE